MMQDWQQRVVDELAALDEKTDKLNLFKHAPAFGRLPLTDQRLLLAQYAIMVAYANVLRLRIERFT